jgi:hypothetical protein
VEGEVRGPVRPPTVVVPDVLGEHHTQVPLTEDQYAVGEFGSDRAYEPFGETARPRAARRNPDYADADVGEDSVEGRCELTGPDGTPWLVPQNWCGNYRVSRGYTWPLSSTLAGVVLAGPRHAWRGSVWVSFMPGRYRPVRSAARSTLRIRLPWTVADTVSNSYGSEG